MLMIDKNINDTVTHVRVRVNLLLSKITIQCSLDALLVQNANANVGEVPPFRYPTCDFRG